MKTTILFSAMLFVVIFSSCDKQVKNYNYKQVMKEVANTLPVGTIEESYSVAENSWTSSSANKEMYKNYKIYILEDQDTLEVFSSKEVSTYPLHSSALGQFEINVYFINSSFLAVEKNDSFSEDGHSSSSSETYWENGYKKTSTKNGVVEKTEDVSINVAQATDVQKEVLSKIHENIDLFRYQEVLFSYEGHKNDIIKNVNTSTSVSGLFVKKILTEANKKVKTLKERKKYSIL